MLRFFLPLLLVFACDVLFAANLRIEPQHANFEPATIFSTVKQTYTLFNDGNKPVVIRDWKAISGHGEAIGLPESIQPGHSHQFQVALTLPGRLGESAFRFALFSDEAGVDRYRFTLSGFVFSLTSPEHALLDFGKVSAGKSGRLEVTLSAREKTALALTGVSDTPDWLEASVSGATVVARIRDDATLGIKAGTITLATNLAQQPHVEITAKAIVEGNLVPSSYALGFRPSEVGNTVTAGLELNYNGKAALEDLDVDVPKDWSVRRSKCLSGKKAGSDCIRITLSRTLTKAGEDVGSLRARMPGEPELLIPIGVMGLAAGQAVRELSVGDGQSDGTPEISKVLRDRVAKPKSDASNAAVNGEKVSRAKGSGPVRLQWTSRNEATVYGYMIYRAEDRAGPFYRISTLPVPAKVVASSANALAEHEFIDSDVAPGSTYYYYIDALSKNGNQSRLSPVLTKTVTP